MTGVQTCALPICPSVKNTKAAKTLKECVHVSLPTLNHNGYPPRTTICRIINDPVHGYVYITHRYVDHGASLPRAAIKGFNMSLHKDFKHTMESYDNSPELWEKQL